MTLSQIIAALERQRKRYHAQDWAARRAIADAIAAVRAEYKKLKGGAD